ncbi:phosphatases II [Suillus variegatus]|nr:phosphatases II [Suillus variegatus]
MTPTLVDPIPTPPPAQFHPNVILKQPKSLIHSKVAIQPWVAQVTHSRTRQLTHLASQYHLSEYNRIKHGHRGCPIPYVPLLLNAPDTFHDLRARQAINMNGVLWWPCPEAGSACPCLYPLLQKELNAALEDTLSSQMPPAPIPEGISHPSIPVKTISTIVPPELLPAMSSHLITNPEPSPVIFHIPEFYTLHRITDYAQHIPSTTSPTSLTVSRKAHSRRSKPILHPPPLPIPPAFMNQPPQSIMEALQAAIDTRLTTLATKTRPSLPFIGKLSLLLSNIVPKFACNRSSSTQRGSSALPKVVFPSMLDFLNSSEREQASSALLRPTSISMAPSAVSSWKVRLAGPVRGRSAVCRDLDTDYDLTVYSCLDDEELDFLGICWSDYVSSAHRAGMDILRIPLPEGLAPLSPQSLDESLTKLIDNYTMRGASILVHCRGGLGRAGLVACCWVLKIGLCGWINGYLQLVERAITVVRRRRSIKAIETLEQYGF